MNTLRARFNWRQAADAEEVAATLARLARPLAGPDDLDPLIERLADKRCVLLGEASHGTAEYYTWRAQITRRLVERHGFAFVAVEGDWPDCYKVNRYVKGSAESGGSAREVLQAFDRWPTWMWANEEIVELTEGLRRHNDGLARRGPALEERKVGFYGLDVYSLWDSMAAVIDYLERTDPAAVDAAKGAYGCFEPYGEDVEGYAVASAFVAETCEDEVVAMLAELRGKAPQYREDGTANPHEAYFDAEQNALIAKNAEHYYRTMVRGGAASWNVRDRHMQETLERLMEFHGPDARAVVWEHNTHIGDARYTDMARDGMVNVGQLARERWGEDQVALVGFGSYEGSVIAGDAWGAPMRRIPVPPAQRGSFEELLHRNDARDALLLFDPEDRTTQETLGQPRGHRAIGVVYHPEREQYGNYVPTVLPRRYDAFLYLDRTTALHPLHLQPRDEHEPPETYPTGDVPSTAR